MKNEMNDRINEAIEIRRRREGESIKESECDCKGRKERESIGNKQARHHDFI
jgi:hypothetical protein